MRKSIISALFLAALPLHMSDADAAAPVDKELFYNSNTKVVFADVSSRAAEDGISEVAAADVAALVAAGATIDPSAQPFLDAEAGNAAPVAPAPDASVTSSATDADVGGVAEDPNAGVSPAASQPASATESSAAPVSPEVATEASESSAPVAPVPNAVFEPASHVSDAPTTGELTAAASVPTPTLAEVPVDDATATTAPVDDNTGNVQVAPAAHAEAKDRFAGLLAELHTFEQDSVAKLKAELLAIGTLLHLHSTASSQAATTGTYTAGDAS
jgi:hypothetical protein